MKRLFILLYLMQTILFAHLSPDELQLRKKPRPDPCPCEKEILVVKPGYSNLGMFSAVNLVLGHLYLFEKGAYPSCAGIQVDFGPEGIYYDSSKGLNWWNYYFQPLFPELSSQKKPYRIPTPQENNAAWIARREMTRINASQLLHKYIKIDETITRKANDFARENFQDYFIIGVHYRGTDKYREVPRVSYEEVVQEILEQIDMLPKGQYRIFVATDEQPFLEYVQDVFYGKVISTNSYRSIDFNNVNHSNENAYRLGEEALVDALLLSKCHLLLRTISNLSLWSTYYNPYLPVIMLNYGYEGHS